MPLAVNRTRSSDQSGSSARASSPACRIHREFRLPGRLREWGTRRWRCWSLLALAMILGRIALLPLLPAPLPEMHDEFSYLLAADTFAHGRIANSTPPDPQFFESPHILVRPTYASKFPPGQGLVLGLGQALMGHPYAGVVLSGALMVLLFCWMADAWLPPQWALIAGALSAVLFFVGNYWFESYWGGSVAAAGGALVVGGLGYLLRGRLAAARFSMAAGAVVLYATRPYEGGVLCLVVLAILGVLYFRARGVMRRAMLRGVILPNLALVVAAAPAALWYNARITGHALELPYVLYSHQYDLAPPLLVLPEYRPTQISNANSHEAQGLLAAHRRVHEGTLRGFLAVHAVLFAVGAVGIPFLGFGLLLLGTPWARMRGRKRCLVLLAGVGAVALFPEVVTFPHYSAPFTPVLLLLIAASGRALWYRLAAVRLRGPLFCLAAAVLFIPVVLNYASAFEAPRSTPRSRLVQQLKSESGRHLVFVDYAKGWLEGQPNGEWVYNGADLAASRVIFAHLRTDRENRELMAQFPGRTVWLVTVGPGEKDVQVKRYSSEKLTSPFSE
jgi:hypothetical protein